MSSVQGKDSLRMTWRPFLSLSIVDSPGDAVLDWLAVAFSQLFCWGCWPSLRTGFGELSRGLHGPSLATL